MHLTCYTITIIYLEVSDFEYSILNADICFIRKITKDVYIENGDIYIYQMQSTIMALSYQNQIHTSHVNT